MRSLGFTGFRFLGTAVGSMRGIGSLIRTEKRVGNLRDAAGMGRCDTLIGADVGTSLTCQEGKEPATCPGCVNANHREDASSASSLIRTSPNNFSTETINKLRNTKMASTLTPWALMGRRLGLKVQD